MLRAVARSVFPKDTQDSPRTGPAPLGLPLSRPRRVTDGRPPLHVGSGLWTDPSLGSLSLRAAPSGPQTSLWAMAARSTLLPACSQDLCPSTVAIATAQRSCPRRYHPQSGTPTGSVLAAGACPCLGLHFPADVHAGGRPSTLCARRFCLFSPPPPMLWSERGPSAAQSADAGHSLGLSDSWR